jgi:hypothetical protein
MIRGSLSVTPSWAYIQSAIRRDFARIRPAIYIAGNKVNMLVSETLHKKVFRTWENTPKVRSKITSSRGSVQYITEVEGDNFFFTTVGAKEHPIFPRGDYSLVFHSSFTPRTKVGSLSSVTGGKNVRSALTVVSYVEKHPGISPRDYDELILDKLSTKILDIIYTEIVIALR